MESRNHLLEDGQALRRHESDLRGDGIDDLNPAALEIPRRLLGQLGIPLDLPDVQDEMLALLEPQLPQSLPQSVRHHMVITAHVDDPDAMAARRRLPPDDVRSGEQADGDDGREGRAHHRVGRVPGKHAGDSRSVVGPMQPSDGSAC